MARVDAHAHLWRELSGAVNGRPVRSLGGGRADFGGETRQMTPPYMLGGSNTADMFLANMDFAGVNYAAITQEYIDGPQDDYLRELRRECGRLRVCCLYRDYDGSGVPDMDGFDGVKICASRLSDRDLTRHAAVFAEAARLGKYVSIDLAEGSEQTGALAELCCEYPALRVAIGHFGMAGRGDWMSQIRLARREGVYIECGGITWLYNSEFYPYPSAVRAIREAADAVGIEKLMWGSDYPRTMTAITYRMSLDFVLNTPELTPREKELFTGGNAVRFYGFPDAEAPERIRHMAED